jgi:hypothetical protein
MSKLLWCLAPALLAAIPLGAQRDTIRFGVPDTLEPALPRPEAPVTEDTTVFDSPGTRDLVLRVIRTGTTVPPELRDYRADMRASVYLALASDTAEGGELPVTVDEIAGEVRWNRGGDVLQTVRGHRVRLLAPTPYTIGSMLGAPWIVPHLYGTTITAFTLSPSPGGARRVIRAVHPFSSAGLTHYRYRAGGRVRVTTAEGVVTLVPISVRPTPAGLLDQGEERLVAGTFWVDEDRAAVARARFGFIERSGRWLVTETGAFFELESALVGRRFWLPWRQRRELQIASPLLGGAAAVRVVTTLSGFDLNTGWEAEEPGSHLVWGLEGGAFAGLPDVDHGDTDIADFSDLVSLVRPPSRTEGLRAALRYDRGDHLVRYNRVEGAFLGAAVRLEPVDPDRRAWHLYAHAGWAFAEATARGELALRWTPGRPGETGPRWSGSTGGYRRLRDMTSFRPPLQWEMGYTLGAALAGHDVRDYYDAAGVEGFVTRRSGPLTLRLGGRGERHRAVVRNTGTYLFGTATDFPEVAPADPGNHAAAEGSVRYARGAGALGVLGGVIAQGMVEQGFGDFATTRATALLSTRFPSRYITLIARGDAGVVSGASPTQFLFRFGGLEGLRGYERNEFGGSEALLGRGRLLLHLPPWGSEPLFRAGLFLFPPLRPALVVSGDAGRTTVSERSRDALARLGARETEGWRSSYGVGLSVFDDALAVERVWPGEGGTGRWYAGFVAYF